MKINIMKRKMIKPCTPTPQNLKNFKISFLDEIAPSMNGSIILFYPSKPEGISQKLEESLRKILPQFYVLAGRYIKSDYSIDCSDEGAEFVEAEAVCDDQADITTEQLEELLPRSTYRMDEATDPLLSVQITDLSRGGLAIGISTSHRIVDASTAATFVAAWSRSAGGGGSGGESPAFSPNFDESPAFFPGRRSGKPYGELASIEATGVECIRLFFDKGAIDNLRARQGKLGFCSKVVVASAVIAKALIRLDRAKHGRSRDCYLNHPVDMRGRTAPPLGKHACGNLVLHSLSCYKAAADGDGVGMFEHLVDLMGGAIRESVSDCARIMSLGGDQVSDIIMRASRDSLPRMSSGEAYGVWFTDCTKFGFYEADFGWGKPVWASLGPVRRPDLVFLMETGDGNGIDATVYLHKNDMRLFEQDEQIRLFAKASKLKYARLSL